MSEIQGDSLREGERKGGSEALGVPYVLGFI